MSTGGQIIVVDDDLSVRESIAEYLGSRTYVVRTAAGGADLDRLLKQAPADLLILDVMMPGEDGIAICERLSLRGMKILMLSALSDAVDRVVGLEMGADDYLVKPFEPRELLARIRALLRRGDRISESDQPLFLFGGWRYDVAARALYRPGGGLVALTSAEHLLLRVLLESRGRVLSRDQILDARDGSAAGPFDRAVDLAISRLRRKLAPSGAQMIETVRGDGYRFACPVRLC